MLGRAFLASIVQLISEIVHYGAEDAYGGEIEGVEWLARRLVDAARRLGPCTVCVAQLIRPLQACHLLVRDD